MRDRPSTRIDSAATPQSGHYRMRSMLQYGSRRCAACSIPLSPLRHPASQNFSRAHFKISHAKKSRAVSALRAPL